MARALSVGDGKGEQRWCARYPTGSSLGSSQYGYFSPTASGPEKSRQTRQESPPGGADFARVATASIWAKVGRELRGTGGGAWSRPPRAVSMVDFALFQAAGWGGIRRTGRAGACSSAWSATVERAGLPGSRGGRDGTTGADFTD